MLFEIGTKSDLSGILELFKQLNESSDSSFGLREAERIWDIIENSNIRYFHAKDDNWIIGVCYICIIPNLTYNGKSIKRNKKN